MDNSANGQGVVSLPVVLWWAQQGFILVAAEIHLWKEQNMRAMTFAVLIAGLTALAGDLTETEVGNLGMLVENGLPEDVIEFIEGYEVADRVELYGLAREFYVFNAFPGQNLDDLVTVCDYAIEDMLASSREEDSELIRKALLEQANIMSFNLSADLAECWPGDTLSRFERHFERGLEAALQSLEWRHFLEKDDEAFFMAHWAAGMHQLSLGQPEQAIYHLVNSLNRAEQMAVDSGIQLGFHSGAGFQMLLAHGYLGLAFMEAGDNTPHYQETIALFQEGIELYPELADDYQFGIDQLEWARKQLDERSSLPQ